MPLSLRFPLPASRSSIGRVCTLIKKMERKKKGVGTRQKGRAGIRCFAAVAAPAQRQGAQLQLLCGLRRGSAPRARTRGGSVGVLPQAGAL